MKSFEDLFALAKGLAVPDMENQRVVEWCDPGEVVGLARESGGGHEIFVAGDRFSARLPLVRRHLRHDRWGRDGKQEFHANRIVLPADPHYVAVAAFLVEELLRNGVSAAPHAALELAEPLIEMALRGTALGEETVVGLLGELCLLEWLLRSAETDEERGDCIGAWRGHEPSARDFVFPGDVAVEVKVTRGIHSRHHINSVSQVDPKRSPEGLPLERLWLLSLGLSSQRGDGQELVTLPQKVDTIVELLGPPSPAGKRNMIQSLFLSYLERYGTSGSVGYSHDEMRTWAAYRGEWYLSFSRAYDMNDDEVAVLTLAELERKHFVLPDTVQFTVDFPDDLTSPGNPRTDVPGFAATLLGEGPQP
jgi:hypothetical protein